MDYDVTFTALGGKYKAEQNRCRELGVLQTFHGKYTNIQVLMTLKARKDLMVFKGEAGCLKIKSRLFGLMGNTKTIYNICIFIYNDNISQTRLKCLTESLVKQQQNSFEIKLIAEEFFFPLRAKSR